MPSSEEVKLLHMPLQDLLMATNEFADANLIGKGGFGNVYRGVSKKHRCIAVKRLDRVKPGQGDDQFKTEIDLLSKYKHENIVSLIGFCDEDDEKILVYKYESKGSLHNYVESKDLTWIQRLQICLDVACGLKYLHDDVGAQHRILHCDIKSSNILLDENWKAKISDFGLSRECPANMQQSKSTFVICGPCGTRGYVAPEYRDDGYLTQKADVYSFGVVLWEVLCRWLTNVKYKDQPLPLYISVQKQYKNQTLDRIIPSDLYKQMNKKSLAIFSEIAYKCLMIVEERPKMQKVVEELQTALYFQRVEEEVHPAAVRDEKMDCKTHKEVTKWVLEQPPEEPKKVEQGKPKKDEEELEEEKEGKKVKEEANLVIGYQKIEKESKELLQKIVLKVPMYCEGCATEVRKCLIGFQGIEDVRADCETQKVVVNGSNADPLQVLERVQKKTSRTVELLSPLPKSPVEERNKQLEQEEPPKEEEKKYEMAPLTNTVVLKVHMNCPGCAQEIIRCILKMKGVESAVPDLNSSQVEVKGNVPGSKLVNHVYKNTGKRAEVLKQDPNPKDKGSESVKHKQKWWR